MKTKRTIRNCDSTFRFRCPLLWEELSPTAADDVRHCGTCDCDVYFCTTDAETIEHAKAGHCIARELPDANERPRIYLGRPAHPPVPTPEQEDAWNWSVREQAIDDSIKNAKSDRSCPQCHFPAPPWRKACRVCGFAMGRKMEKDG